MVGPPSDWLHHILHVLSWLTERFKQLEASNQLLETPWKRFDPVSEVVSHPVVGRSDPRWVLRLTNVLGASRQIQAAP